MAAAGFHPAVTAASRAGYCPQGPSALDGMRAGLFDVSQSVSSSSLRVPPPPVVFAQPPQVGHRRSLPSMTPVPRDTTCMVSPCLAPPATPVTPNNDSVISNRSDLRAGQADAAATPWWHAKENIIALASPTARSVSPECRVYVHETASPAGVGGSVLQDSPLRRNVSQPLGLVARSSSSSSLSHAVSVPCEPCGKSGDATLAPGATTPLSSPASSRASSSTGHARQPRGSQGSYVARPGISKEFPQQTLCTEPISENDSPVVTCGSAVLIGPPGSSRAFSKPRNSEENACGMRPERPSLHSGGDSRSAALLSGAARLSAPNLPVEESSHGRNAHDQQRPPPLTIDVDQVSARSTHDAIAGGPPRSLPGVVSREMASREDDDRKGIVAHGAEDESMESDQLHLSRAALDVLARAKAESVQGAGSGSASSRKSPLLISRQFPPTMPTKHGGSFTAAQREFERGSTPARSSTFSISAGDHESDRWSPANGDASAATTATAAGRYTPALRDYMRHQKLRGMPRTLESKEELRTSARESVSNGVGSARSANLAASTHDDPAASLRAQLQEAAMQAQYLCAAIEAQDVRRRQLQTSAPRQLGAADAEVAEVQFEWSLAEASLSEAQQESQTQHERNRAAGARVSEFRRRLQETTQAGPESPTSLLHEAKRRAVGLQGQMGNLEVAIEQAAVNIDNTRKEVRDLEQEVERLQSYHSDAHARLREQGAARAELWERLASLSSTRGRPLPGTAPQTLVTQIGTDWAEARRRVLQHEADWREVEVDREELHQELAAANEAVRHAGAGLAAVEQNFAVGYDKRCSRTRHADEELAAARAEHRLLRESQSERHKARQHLVGLIEDLRADSCQGAAAHQGLAERLTALQGVVDDRRGARELPRPTPAIRNNEDEDEGVCVDSAALASAVEENDRLHKRLLELRDDKARLIREQEDLIRYVKSKVAPFQRAAAGLDP